MAITKALVTDDSKSARVVLQRMLEGLTFEVDAVESAVDAIRYLEEYQPDVIFMDHMMPGMDGFEAVKRIKANPKTAKIPIVMYTSKGGDVYISQARALGAAGVIPKTISPVSLKETLYELGLIDNMKKETRSAVKLVDKDVAEKTPSKASQTANFLIKLRQLLDEQTVELHKSMWLSVESVANEIFNRLNQKLEKQFERMRILTEKNQSRNNRKSTITHIILGALLLLLIIFNIILLHDVSQLKEQLQSNGGQVKSFEKNNLSRGSVNRTVGAVSPTAKKKLNLSASNRTIKYPYNEQALNDKRIRFVREIVEQAIKESYQGVIKLQTHVGLFCLSTKENGDYVLSDEATAITDCDYIGNGAQPDDAIASHQSLSFANYLSSLQVLSKKGIKIEVSNVGRRTALSPYPTRDSGATALQWNLAAQDNNRVTVKLKPAP